MVEERDTQDSETGITSADMERIEAYLKKRQYQRSVDDLRPESEN